MGNSGVSTSRQHLARQIDALTKAGIDQANIYVDKKLRHWTCRGTRCGSGPPAGRCSTCPRPPSVSPSTNWWPGTVRAAPITAPMPRPG
ncbi:hypothetical protein CJ179_01630 [Rhodococcus sp. ACS1]|nr:hypothetical protein CJ179_01630 [Rhodococcus sp. ACS1]